MRRALLLSNGQLLWLNEYESFTVPRGSVAALVKIKPKAVLDSNTTDARDDQIEHMVNRFLGWRLPEHFSPDAGISFTPEFNVEYNAKHGKPAQRHEPTGTNLFSATQAEDMVRYMLEGLPE